jgi:hypothetical protein
VGKKMIAVSQLPPAGSNSEARLEHDAELFAKKALSNSKAEGVGGSVHGQIAQPLKYRPVEPLLVNVTYIVTLCPVGTSPKASFFGVASTGFGAADAGATVSTVSEAKDRSNVITVLRISASSEDSRRQPSCLLASSSGLFAPLMASGFVSIQG